MNEAKHFVYSHRVLMQGLYLASKLPKLMPNTFITHTNKYRQPTTTAADAGGNKDSEKKELEVRGGCSISKVKLVMIGHFKPFLSVCL